MKCFKKDCQKEATVYDYETPSIFENPDEPGTLTRPKLCQEHYDEMIWIRKDNERSWDIFVESL